MRVLTAGVGAIGGISLVVGAFGIATIMTIAVSERTGEVGLLRALGAPKAQILALFLVEAISLGFIGGVVGVVFAVSLIALVGVVAPSLPLAVSWPYVGVALVLSLFIGALAGVWPALRAASMDPIDALRAE